MTATRIFCAIALTLFVVSCVFYKRGSDDDGDRLLLLAYGAMLCGWLALLERMGLLR